MKVFSQYSVSGVLRFEISEIWLFIFRVDRYELIHFLCTQLLLDNTLTLIFLVSEAIEIA